MTIDKTETRKLVSASGASNKLNSFVDEFTEFVANNNPTAQCHLAFTTPIELNINPTDLVQTIISQGTVVQCNGLFNSFLQVENAENKTLAELCDTDEISVFISSLASNNFELQQKTLSFKPNKQTKAKHIVVTCEHKVANNHLTNLWLVLEDRTEQANALKHATALNKRHLSFINENPDAIAFLQINPPLNLELPKEQLEDILFDNLRVHAASESWCKLKGLSREKIQQSSLAKLFGKARVSHMISRVVANKFHISDADGTTEKMEVIDASTGERQWLAITFQSIIYKNMWLGGWLTFHNQSELVLQKKQLEFEQRKHESFVAKSPNPIACLVVEPPMPLSLSNDEQISWLTKNSYLYIANKAYAKWLGKKDSASLVNNSLDHILWPEHNAEQVLQLCLLKNYNLVDYQWSRIDKKTGEKSTFLTSITGEIVDDKLTEYWTSHVDISERDRHLNELQHIINHDELTGVASRAYFNETIEALCAAQTHFSVFVIDLTMFKSVNDSLGHDIADQCLKIIATRLQTFANKLGDEHLLARVGGDEFALIYQGAADSKTIKKTGNQLLRTIKKNFKLKHLSLNLSASIGAVSFPEQSSNPSELLKNVESAKNQAKIGQMGVAIYDVNSEQRQHNHLETLSDLRTAIKNNELILYFQPLMELHSNKIIGVEALMRWNHPVRGLVAPNEFIPSAESTEIIHDISRFAIQESLKCCKQWWDKDNPISVAVNISARNLLNPKIIDIMKAGLEQYGLPVEALKVEITESSLVKSSFAISDWLDKLQEMGVALSIDDFGTGFSSLTYLKKLPVSTLKIDRSFTQTMLNDSHDEAIIDSVINLGHNLGLTVVAEGVEDEGQLANLQNKLCDFAQGFHIAKPMPASQFITWLDQHNNTQLH